LIERNKLRIMNKTVWIVSVILLFSCTSNPVSKPKNLLDEDTMVAIMYDVAVLQAASANAPDQLHQKGIDAKNFIYKKYKIDSATYHQNSRYYAGDVKHYKKMYKKVLERLEQNPTTKQ